MNQDRTLVNTFIRIAVLLLTLAACTAFSAEPTTDQAGLIAPVSMETLNAKIKEVEATTTLDDPTKTKLTEFYRKTLSSLEAMRSNKEAEKAYRQARDAAPKKTQALRKEIEQTQNRPPSVLQKISDETPLAEIDQLFFKEKANLAAVEAKLADVEKQLSDEVERPSTARKQLNEAKQKQLEIAAELKQATPEGELSVVTEARRWLLETRNQALSSEIKMLDQELLSQPMRVDLLEAGRDRSLITVNRMRPRVERLEEILGQRRRSEAEASVVEAEKAKREATGKHPLVQQLAENNAVLSQQLTALADNLDRVRGEYEVASRESKRITDDFRSAQQKIEIASLSEGLGQVLREQRRALPDLRRFKKEAGVTGKKVADASLVQLKYADERRQLRDIDAYIATLTIDLKPQEATGIEDELRALIISRKTLLDKGIATNDAYLRALGELDFERGQLLKTAQAYDEFLAERLLWIRSSAPISLSTIALLPQHITWLLSPSHWTNVVKGIVQQATASPVLIMALAVVGILLWNTNKLRAALHETGKPVSKVSVDHFSSTTRALVITLVLATPWPLLLIILGWQLGLAPDISDFSKAVSATLIKVSPAFFFLLAFRQLCKPGGLAAVHFRWPETGLQRLRHSLLPLITVGLPAGFIAGIFFTMDITSAGDAPGRLTLIIVLIILALFLYTMFDPRKGALEPFMTRHPHSALGRMPYLWLTAALLIPIALTGLALFGYVLTAAELTGSLFETLWLIFGLVVVHQLAVRWLLLTQRRLKYKAALAKREEQRAAREAEKAGQPEAKTVSDEILEQAVEPEVDLVALSDESRELLTMGLVILGIVGIWAIWSEVLPAFGFLDEFAVWNRTGIVDGEEKILPVTLADIILALLVVMLTVFATKRLPALLEITLLQRLDMTPGGRYATTTLSRYFIVAVGAILAFNILGADGSKLHWLAAALGVGIGFGLQEIVANFISGLIILFERPIRVGDVVTVGDTDGVVTRIRIRATTILNWDKKELLVPNKEFITGRLLNWSLSDQTTRILVPVGIAYGSDVQKAMALMAEAAEKNQYVLEDPAPFVRFEGFGDNALALNLRAYVGSLDHRLMTVSDLHETINEKFIQAGIVISFPQRDIHLDTSQPLDIRIHRGNRDSNIKP